MERIDSWTYLLVLFKCSVWELIMGPTFTHDSCAGWGPGMRLSWFRVLRRQVATLCVSVAANHQKLEVGMAWQHGYLLPTNFSCSLQTIASTLRSLHTVSGTSNVSTNFACGWCSHTLILGSTKFVTSFGVDSLILVTKALLTQWV